MVLIDLLSLPFDQLVTQFFLPFILIFAILWALMSIVGGTIGFSRKINIVLSLGISILVANTEFFPLIANTVFQYSGFAAVIVFGVVLVFGIARWGFTRGRDIYETTGHSYKKIERIDKEIAKLQRKIAETADPAKKRALAATIEHLERDRRIAAAEG